MAAKKPRTNNSKREPTNNELKRIAIEEWHRTARTIALCVLGGFCVWTITNAVVKLLDKPPWVAVVLALITALGSASIQAPLLIRVRSYIKNWTQRNISRLSQLEGRVDPGRTSSGLQPDGTDPPESAE